VLCQQIARNRTARIATFSLAVVMTVRERERDIYRKRERERERKRCDATGWPTRTYLTPLTLILSAKKY
jgi:hypothetical protein